MLLMLVLLPLSAKMSKIYQVIAQRDSSSNLKIAEAAKQDSETMKLIGLLTTFFLPATFVSV